MTSTITHQDAGTSSPVGSGQGPVGGPVAPPPPKLRRRPALVAAAVAAICLGGLLGAWAWTSTTSTQEVLVARTEIPRGAVIEAGDLARARVNPDPALNPVPASRLEELVGQRAALDIAAGTLLTPATVDDQVVPEDGTSVVGVALLPGQAPGLDLQAGDRVRVVLTPGVDGELVDSPAFTVAEVAAVRHIPETGQTVVDVLVPAAEATVLAARVATGNVALVLDSRER
jgi:hypothetical protein